MTTTFASIYVHSIEATSLLHLFTLVADINYAFRQVELPPIFIFSNHDSVGVNILYSFIMPTLFAYCYDILSHANFLSKLAKKDFGHKVIRTVNPNFIKF